MFDDKQIIKLGRLTGRLLGLKPDGKGYYQTKQGKQTAYGMGERMLWKAKAVFKTDDEKGANHVETK